MSQTCGRKTGGSGSLHSSLSDVTYLFNAQEHARLGIRDFRHGHKEAHVAPRGSCFISAAEPVISLIPLPQGLCQSSTHFKCDGQTALILGYRVKY